MTLLTSDSYKVIVLVSLPLEGKENRFAVDEVELLNTSFVLTLLAAMVRTLSPQGESSLR